MTERAAAQSHFNDLCALLGHDDPISADPRGECFTFEKGVTKSGGGDGFADVWKRNHFAWEYKKKKRDLGQALAQLVRYAAALENPPLHVACDTDRFVVQTAWTNTVPQVHEITLDQLADPEKLDILHSVFFDPEKLRPKRTRQALTAEAADKFSAIAFRLQGRGSPEDIAHFVNQLVFCFFASSVRLLPDGFFPRLLTHAEQRPRRASDYFDRLFAAMETGGEFDLTDIAHFNGGLFDGRRALPLDEGDISLLKAAAVLDWSQIDPTIFGTLFERFLDPDKRAQIGAHYTDPDKIMMIVDPVVLRPLAREWDEVKAKITPLTDKAAAIVPASRHRADLRAADRAVGKLHSKALALRDNFLDRLGAVRILDPACGSGNFLYLALQGVKDLENRVVLECEALGLPPRGLYIGPEILKGIEINPLAAELARTTIWIGDIQWRRRNGIYTDTPPILRKLDNIECRDALIAAAPAPLSPRPEEAAPAAVSKGPAPSLSPHPEEAAPAAVSKDPGPIALGEKEKRRYIEAPWPEADFIVGNPPFLGSKYFRKGRPARGKNPAVKGLGDAYTNALYNVFAGRVPKSADLCTYWFSKAVAACTNGGLFGLVATKAIAKGTNSTALKAICSSKKLRIFVAWTNEPWVIDRTQVRVALICVGPRGSNDEMAYLNGQAVQVINSDLTSGIDLGVAKRLQQNAEIAFQGVKLNGPFEIGGDLARQMLAEPLNVNGLPNRLVVRRFIQNDDVTERPLDDWVIDFFEYPERTAASQFQTPFELVSSKVLPHRNALSTSSATEVAKLADYWLMQRPRPNLRRAIATVTRCILVPETSEHRIFVWGTTTAIFSGSLFVIARDDETSFGLLCSRFHDVWATVQGNRLGAGNQRRYNVTRTFETFPFPEGLTPDIPAADYADDPRAIAIAAAARRLDELRNAWLNPPDLVRIEPEVVPGFPDRVLPTTVEAAAKLRERTLTKLYNQRPQWLADAHRDLDAAVAAAYGWPADISEDDALARLLDLNLSRPHRT